MHSTYSKRYTNLFSSKHIRSIESAWIGSLANKAFQIIFTFHDKNGMTKVV